MRLSREAGWPLLGTWLLFLPGNRRPTSSAQGAKATKSIAAAAFLVCIYIFIDAYSVKQPLF